MFDRDFEGQLYLSNILRLQSSEKCRETVKDLGLSKTDERLS